MVIDKTTLLDLSIFQQEEEESVFHHYNFTTTSGGKQWLKHIFDHPLHDINKIQQTQHVIRLFIKQHDRWPTIITNGTLMVVEKYFENPIEDLPQHPNLLSSITYRFINASDYSLVKYSVNHFADFAIGLQQVSALFEKDDLPQILKELLNRVEKLLQPSAINELIASKKKNTISHKEFLSYGRFLRREFKAEALELVDIYSRIDAYLSMAKACSKFELCFPEIEKTSSPYLEATGLYHPLLSTPVAYNVGLNQDKNFMFLTGANMAGKSTFIKTIGVAAYLAHLGMGVPAVSTKLSLFHGLLSNIQIEDNITKGESYFFNEVQRIKKTITKISDGENWLILIDELFKGTNVQDAMKCSTVVIEGLLKMKNAIFILSTHLYEIGTSLQQYPNIRFSYFETHINDGQLSFSYLLKDGISNDRLGFLILKREGVVDMLDNL